MSFLHSIPAMPVSSIPASLSFYCNVLGFKVVHHEGTFAIVRREGVEVHLWEAGDESWRDRSCDAPVVISGAESFIAGTASFRIAVNCVDELHKEWASQNIFHPNAPLGDRPWGTREFAVLDPDNNLITFFERK